MLELNAVHGRYGSALALHGVSLAAYPGQVVALMGRNGMGKSSVLKAIMRLDEPIVTKGSITVDGKSLLTMPSHQIGRLGLGYVPQGRRVFPSLSVVENLTVAARRGSEALETRWDLPRIFHLFPRLEERSSQLAGSLSGGEQQMLAIARALLINPRMLLMDEPTEGLAPSIVQQLGETIHRLRNDGVGVVLAEQAIRFALELADHVYLIENGRTVASGTGHEIDASQELKERYLGVPG